jgi:hypothetical protein
MLRPESLIITLVQRRHERSWPPESATQPRRQPKTYSDHLIVKALVILIIRRLSTAYTLRTFLPQGDRAVQEVRPLVHEHGRFPSRHT